MCWISMKLLIEEKNKGACPLALSSNIQKAFCDFEKRPNDIL